MRLEPVGGRLPVPAALRGLVFRGADAISAGLVSSTRLRQDYVRVLRGTYVAPGVALDHGVKTLAARLWLPEHAVLIAHSAAWWYGIRHAAVSDPVTVALRPQDVVAGPQGVRIHRCELAVSDVNVTEGRRVSSPLATAWFCALLLPPPEALAAVDALLRTGLVTTRELLARLEASSGQWGVRRARAVFECADPRSESAAESWTRWLLRVAGIPEPVLQHLIHRPDGSLVARVDFCWPDQRVILEYDGSYHDDPAQQAADARRQADLEAMGWTVIRMTAADWRDTSRVLNELRVALGY